MKRTIALLAGVLLLTIAAHPANAVAGPPPIEVDDMRLFQDDATHILEELGENSHLDLQIIGSKTSPAVVLIKDTLSDWRGIGVGGNSVFRNAIILVPPDHGISLVAESYTIFENVQIVGQGPDSGSWGLEVAGAITFDGGTAAAPARVDARNLIIAGHTVALRITTALDRPDRHGAVFHATDLYVTNNHEGVIITGRADSDAFYGTITMNRAYIWNNSGYDLFLGGGMRVEITDSWIPNDPALTSSNLDQYQGYKGPILQGFGNGSRVVFRNSVLSENLVPWLFKNPGVASFHRNLVQIINDGPLGDIQLWPRPIPWMREDFTNDNQLDVEDFRHLAKHYGQESADITSGLVLDLDSSGTVDAEDMLRFAYVFAGLSQDQSLEELFQSPSTQILAMTLAQDYRSVAEQLANDARFSTYLNVYLADIPTSVAEIAGETPDEFGLNQNYPNPFNSGTNIAFSLPEEGDATLTVFSLTGQKITTLAAGYFAAGKYNATWDGLSETGQPAGSGVYIYRLNAGEYAKTGRMTLLK